jgi:hypothetical protein
MPTSQTIEFQGDHHFFNSQPAWAPGDPEVSAVIATIPDPRPRVVPIHRPTSSLATDLAAEPMIEVTVRPLTSRQSSCCRRCHLANGWVRS